MKSGQLLEESLEGKNWKVTRVKLNYFQGCSGRESVGIAFPHLFLRAGSRSHTFFIVT